MAILLRLVLLTLFTFLSFCRNTYANLPANESYPSGKPKVEWRSISDPSKTRRIEHYENGNIKNEAFYNADVLNGVYSEFYESGNIRKKLDYRDGISDGLYREYLENGSLLKEATYVQGKLEGSVKEFYGTGKVSTQTFYINDRPYGALETFYPEGQLKERTPIENGKFNGISKKYFENGALWLETTFVDGKKNGAMKQYYPDGSIQLEINFVDDRQKGFYREYYGSGSVHVEAEIDGEDITRKKIYSENAYFIKEKIDFLSEHPLAVILFLFVIAYAIFLISDIRFKNKLIKSVPVNIAQPDKTPPSSGNEIDLKTDVEKMYRSVVEQIKSGIFMVNELGILVYANNTLAQLLGYKTKQDMIGLNMKTEILKSTDDKDTFFGLFKDANEVSDQPFQFRMKDNTMSTLSFSGNKIWNEKGEMSGILGVIQDITEKSRIEQLFQIEKHKLEALFGFFDTIDQIRDLQELYGHVIKGISDIMNIKRCSIMIFEKDQDLMTIKAASGVPELVLSQTKMRRRDPIAGIVAENKEPLLVKNIDYDKQFGAYRKAHYQGRSFIITPLILGDDCKGVINITEKISEIEEGKPFEDIDLKIMRLIAQKVSAVIDNISIYTELDLLTTTDPMTNVYNYRKFLAGLDHEIQKYKRNKTDLYVFMIDLDDFKSYNDTFGHQEGDELLRNVGRILKETLRTTDLVCRYAGDEFCVVVCDIAADDLRYVAQKIIIAIGQFPFERKVTMSIGIAKFQEGLSKKDFINKADEALYKAKHSGKNQVVIDT